MERDYGYHIRLSRPPHYVDGIRGGFTSYDAYALMGYQYMAASFDGAGWLPLDSYEAEVEATWRPMEKILLEDPDYFRGQIIFQKDGFNMARRAPVADGLDKQLQLLTDTATRWSPYPSSWSNLPSRMCCRTAISAVRPGGCWVWAGVWHTRTIPSARTRFSPGESWP